MDKHIEFVKTIASIERLRNSLNGNPRYRIQFTDGSVALTQTDSSVAYEITNKKFIGVPVLFKATPAGRIWDATPVLGADAQLED